MAFGKFYYNIALTIKELSFEELSEKCSVVKAGAKNEDYFIRGGEMVLSPPIPDSSDPAARKNIITETMTVYYQQK